MDGMSNEDIERMYQILSNLRSQNSIPPPSPPFAPPIAPLSPWLPPSPHPRHPPSAPPPFTSFVLPVALGFGGACVLMLMITLVVLLVSPRLREKLVRFVWEVSIACAQSPCFEGLLPLPRPLATQMQDYPLKPSAESQMEAALDRTLDTESLEIASFVARDSTVDRKLLRERIARGGADERKLLYAETAELETASETIEIAARAESSLTSTGSPDAALLAAVSRNASALEVRALLSRGANPDAAFLDRCALAIAARRCSVGVVKVLIDWGATLELKDGMGWTPLMHAIDAHSNSCSRETVLILLLDSGASVDVWGNDLKGPLDLMEARERQQEQERINLSRHSQVEISCPATEGMLDTPSKELRDPSLSLNMTPSGAGHHTSHDAPDSGSSGPGFGYNKFKPTR
uniref:Uncharacterized protein n=1 Tax=Haptolina brevifila TaxID=156173 RepID=A0A7S2C314_9EUKA